MLNCDERRKEILNIIEKNKHMTIEALSKIFNANEQIIYRDLIYLEKIHKINRTSKGAIFSESNEKKNAINLIYRETLNYKDKEAIGKFATSLIKDEESLMIDGGSTTLLFATNLLNKNKLMVITNTSTIGNIIKKGKKNRVILTGGKLLKNTYATTGKMAEKVIEEYKVNKAILGVCSIDINKLGFYTSIEEEAKIKRKMIMASNELIILADSSKVNIEKPHLVCSFNLNKKITLIIDRKLDKKNQEILEKNNINIIKV